MINDGYGTVAYELMLGFLTFQGNHIISWSEGKDKKTTHSAHQSVKPHPKKINWHDFSMISGLQSFYKPINSNIHGIFTLLQK